MFQGSIFDGQDIFEHMMTRSNVMPRLNSRVLNPGEKYLDLTKDMRKMPLHCGFMKFCSVSVFSFYCIEGSIISVSSSAATIVENTEAFASLSAADMSSAMAVNLPYIAKKGEYTFG